MSQTVGLKDFRENLPKYEKRIKAGQSFVIFKHSEAIFTVSPVNEGSWETVIDFTKFRKNGIPVDELIARIKKKS